MKTLLNVKDEVAQEFGYGDWDESYLWDDVTNSMIDEVAKRYAAEAIQEAADRARTKKTGNSGSYYDASVDKQSILNLINELK